MKYFMLGFSVLVLLISCNREKVGFVNPKVENILQFNDNKTSGAKIGELINNINAIRLETNEECLIGNIEQIRTSNGNLFILDDQNHSVLVFDDHGDFLFKISAQGKGPGQYQFLRDFFIDEIKNEIIVLGSPNKVMRFDMTGGFISEQSLDFTPLKFVSINNERSYYFWNGINSINYAPLIKTDENFNLIESYFAESEEELTTSNMFTKFKESIYLRPFFDKHDKIIHELTSTEIKSKYQIDFGSRNWPETIEINRDSKYREKGYIYGVTNFFEGRQWITFNFTSEKIYHYAIYNKETQKSYWWPSFIAGTLPEAILSDISFMEDDSFYSIAEPFYLKKYLDDFKKNDKEYDYSHISESLRNIYALLERVDELDNPIVFVLSLN